MTVCQAKCSKVSTDGELESAILAVLRDPWHTYLIDHLLVLGSGTDMHVQGQRCGGVGSEGGERKGEVSIGHVAGGVVPGLSDARRVARVLPAPTAFVLSLYPDISFSTFAGSRGRGSSLQDEEDDS